MAPGLGVAFLDPGSDLGVAFLDPPPCLGVVPRGGRSGNTLTPNGVGGLLSDSVLLLLELLQLLPPLLLLGITKLSILVLVNGIV